VPEPLRVPAAAPRDEASSLRPFRAAYWFGGFNGITWMIGLGTPMVLLAEKLGATAFQVGLASAFVFLLLPVQVLSTATLARLGYRRQMVIAWLARASFLLIPLSLALSAPESPPRWMPNALVASVFGFCLLRAFGVAAHIPWLAAILPDRARGRFFATDHAIVSAVGVGTLLLCSTLFDRLRDYDAFAIVYALSILGSLLATWNLLRLPDATPPAPAPLRTLASEARRLCLRPGLFRHYLVLSLLGSVVATSLGPFTIYYLKVEAGFASSRLLTFTAAQFGGMIAATWAIRRSLDVVPIRRFFQLASSLVALVNLYWWSLVSGEEALLRFLPAAYFLSGVAVGTQNAAHFTFLPELSEEVRRPVAIAVFTAVLGLLAGLAPIAWGLLLKQSGPAPGIVVSRFALFFALGIAVNALLVALFVRLPDHRAWK